MGPNMLNLKLTNDMNFPDFYKIIDQLPDKCVEALEAWSDSLLEGEE